MFNIGNFKNFWLFPTKTTLEWQTGYIKAGTSRKFWIRQQKYVLYRIYKLSCDIFQIYSESTCYTVYIKLIIISCTVHRLLAKQDKHSTSCTIHWHLMVTHLDYPLYGVVMNVVNFSVGIMQFQNKLKYHSSIPHHIIFFKDKLVKKTGFTLQMYYISMLDTSDTGRPILVYF